MSDMLFEEGVCVCRTRCSVVYVRVKLVKTMWLGRKKAEFLIVTLCGKTQKLKLLFSQSPSRVLQVNAFLDAAQRPALNPLCEVTVGTEGHCSSVCVREEEESGAAKVDFWT